MLLAGGGIVVRVLSDSTSNQHAKKDSVQPRTNEETNFFGGGKPTLPLPLWLTKNEDFYTVRYDEIPDVSLSSWSLLVHGLVHEQVRLTYDELKALPSVMTMHTLECIGNPVGGNLIGNAEWRGISFRSLLDRAGLDAKSSWVVIGGVDEYFTSVPLSTAKHEHALLAYEMNGEPLPLRHGFPLRAILPGVYGQKQPKWVTGIKVTDGEEPGPWEQKGWSRGATIKLNSAIKIPKDAQSLGHADLLIAGVAHAGEAGVRSVQISTDGGNNWNETTLTRGPSPYVWTPWGYLFHDPVPGRYTLMVRATDNRGKTQDQLSPGILADVFPDGTSAIHSITIEVREG